MATCFSRVELKTGEIVFPRNREKMLLSCISLHAALDMHRTINRNRENHPKQITIPKIQTSTSKRKLRIQIKNHLISKNFYCANLHKIDDHQVKTLTQHEKKKKNQTDKLMYIRAV
jgi:hypothetical protein